MELLRVCFSNCECTIPITKLNDCNYSGKNCGRIYICIASIASIYISNNLMNL